ncbi:MAG: acyl-CoA desaturase, partial [Nostoc sp.]
ALLFEASAWIFVPSTLTFVSVNTPFWVAICNSVSHVYGTHPYQTGDQSKNNPWVAIPTFGESWHNNHHAFESSAAIGLKWWQVDFGYAVVWILAKLGLVWDVNLPTAKMMAAKKITIAQD